MQQSDSVPSFYPATSSYTQLSNNKRRVLSCTNETSEQSANCLESEVCEQLDMPSTHSHNTRRRQGRMSITRPSISLKAKSDLCIQRRPDRNQETGIGAVAQEEAGETNSRVALENEELIVPGFEDGPESSLLIHWVKDEPHQIVALDQDESSEDFDPSLQSSMEMIFQLDEQHPRDQTVGHADSTVGRREVELLPKRTRISVAGLRAMYEVELARRDKEIEDLKKENENLKLKNKDCQFCHLLPTASSETITFMENLLETMRASKEPVIQEEDNAAMRHFSPSNNSIRKEEDNAAMRHFSPSNNSIRKNIESQDLLCESSEEWNPPSRHGKKMVPLYPGSEVMISEEAKCLALLRANGNPRKLITCTLKALYTKEELSGFSALGQRENKPFPPNVTTAIKMFVLSTCKTGNGRPPLSESEFHKVLNARFGVARRDLKKDDGKRYMY